MIWVRMLAYITGRVDKELLLRNDYLTAENRILRAQIKGWVLLSDAEKATLAEVAHRLGRKALKEVAAAAKPDTLLAWYRKLIAKKFDGSKFRKSVGRPPVEEEIKRLVVRMARENLSCSSFCQLIEAEKVKALALPPKGPNLNAYAERWVRSVKEECVAKLILFGERSLKRALHHYELPYHRERNHQGKDNLRLFPSPTLLLNRKQGKVRRRERLGGLHKYYEREAA